MTYYIKSSIKAGIMLQQQLRPQAGKENEIHL